MPAVEPSPASHPPRPALSGSADPETACRLAGLTHLSRNDTWEGSLNCLERLREPFARGHDTRPRLRLDLPLDVTHMREQHGWPRALLAHDDRVFLYDDRHLCVVDLPFATAVQPTWFVMAISDIQRLAPVDRTTLLLARSRDVVRFALHPARITHQNAAVPTVLSLAVAPDAPRAVTGHDDGVRLWHTASLELLQVVPSSSPVRNVILRAESFLALLESDKRDPTGSWRATLVAGKSPDSAVHVAELGAKPEPITMAATGAATYVTTMGFLLAFSGDLEGVEKWCFPRYGRTFAGPTGRLAAVRPGNVSSDDDFARLSYFDVDTAIATPPMALDVAYDAIEAAGFVHHERWFAFLSQAHGQAQLTLLDPLQPPPAPRLGRRARLSRTWKRWRAPKPKALPAKPAWPRSVVTEFESALSLVSGGGSEPLSYELGKHVSNAREALAAACVRDPDVLAKRFLALLSATERRPETDAEAAKLGTFVATLLAVVLYAGDQNDSLHGDHAALVRAILSDLCGQEPLRSWLSALAPTLRSIPNGALQARAWLRHVDATVQALLALSVSSLTRWRDPEASSIEQCFWSALWTAAVKTRLV